MQRSITIENDTMPFMMLVGRVLLFTGFNIYLVDRLTFFFDAADPDGWHLRVQLLEVTQLLGSNRNSIHEASSLDSFCDLSYHAMHHCCQNVLVEH